ncbi:MAG: hypothetical protein EOP84_09420 [Verrucomicrobiaceae bacterium]|nr:MAG: hypothetical protein EOP84_09420 [Verrucomicrobiaceae bacterium]
MLTFSVNEAIEMLDGLAGKDIRVRGLLSFEFENVSLNHVQLADRAEGYASSVWLTVGSGAVSVDEEVCQRLHGKVVVVQGTLHKPDPKFGGCGHMSLWPAEIVSRTIERAPDA